MNETRSIRRRVLVSLMAVLVVSAVKGQEEVKVKWGVADSTAIVGRPFRLHIPSDAFSHSNLAYKIRVSENEGLPAWLEFNEKENILQGIPTQKDAGQLDLEVVGKGPTNEASTTFSVLVRNVQSHTSGSPLKFKKSGPEFVRCKHEEPETVATIIIDADMETMPVQQRLGLLTKFLDHMELQEEMVKMVPVGSTPMHDNSALVSGTGDCTAPKTTGTFISWPVGCGQVKEGHFPILQRLDDDSSNGNMAKKLEFSIIGWHVTNSHIQAPKRKRRQALATPTPVVTPVAPTKTEPTDEVTEDDMDKLTRAVVEVEASPTMIKPTATQPEMPKTDEPMKPDEVDKEDDTDDMIRPTVVEPPTSQTGETPPIKPTMTDKDDATDMPKPDMGPVCVTGKAPVANTDVFSRLTAQAGKIFDFEIPEDAFEDCESGGTRGLDLFLFNEDMSPLPEGFFIQLDKVNQKIIGLPMDNDVERYRLILVGQKKNTMKTLLDSLPFTLIVKSRKSVKKINHELSVTIDYPYDVFKSSVVNQTNLANKIARVYGDEDSSNLVITKMEEGSVIFGWANKSAMSSGCPVDEIKGLVDKLVDKNGQLTQEAIDTLAPFSLSGAASAPAGSCQGVDGFPIVKSMPRDKTPTVTDPPVVDTTTKAVEKDKDTGVVDPDMDKDDETDAQPDKDTGEIDSVQPETDDTTTKKMDDKEEDDDDKAKQSKDDGEDDDVLITTVVPGIVVVAIVIIALIIACILYRKKRKGKMNVEEQDTFVNKGAPVIFPDELEDKPSDVNKPLLVEGGSPAPPEYHRGASESPEPDLVNNHRNNYNNVNSAPNDDGIQELPERPYEPPAPPVTGSSANKQPRPTQQQPFSQPPQILP